MTLGKFPEGLGTTAVHSLNERIREIADAFASPVSDAIKNSALSKLNLPSIESALAKHLEMDKFMTSFEETLAHMADWNDLAFQPPQLGRTMNFPALPQPIPVELLDPVPVRVELPEPVVAEPPPWWRQGWLWGAVGCALVVVDIVLRLI